jgi:Protein of unknown function (DUF3352)
VLLAAALAGLIAGCGSTHATGTNADPAGAIPASAPLYAGIVVRPEGALRTAALSAGRALTHQADPYLRLVEALKTPGSAPLNFNSDVASWLGPRAGIFLSSLDASGSLLTTLLHDLLGASSTTSAFPFAANGAQGAIVLDTKDPAKARSFLDSQARRAGARLAGYRGVSYQATPGGLAFGVIDRFAVIGSEAGLHGVIDTTLGEPSLADTASYAKLAASAPSGAIAHLYANPAAGVPAAAGQGPTSLFGLFAGPHPVDISLVPSAGSVTLDGDALVSGSAAQAGGLIASGPEGARALGELPANSWLAVGLGNIATTLAGDVQGLDGLALLGSSLSQGSPESSASGTFNLKGLLEGILHPLSVLGANSAEARRAFQSWMGSAGIFASGSGLVELRAGAVIASKDPALSRAAVTKLGNALSQAGGSVQPTSVPGTEAAVTARVAGLPVELVIANGRAANGQTKFVIGLGESSVGAALNPSSTLSAASSRSAAASALGEGIQPSIIGDFPTLLSLLEGVGLSEDPLISEFVPYLRTLTTLAGGEKSLGGGVERFRLVVGLQQTG